MKSQTSKPDKHVSSKGNDEDLVMIVLHAIAESTNRKVDEKSVREGVDDLGGIRCGIVVLLLSNPVLYADSLHSNTHDFTPVDRAGISQLQVMRCSGYKSGRTWYVASKIPRLVAGMESMVATIMQTSWVRYLKCGGTFVGRR